MTLAFNTIFREASKEAAKLTFDRDLIAEIAGLVARSVLAEREACAKMAGDEIKRLRKLETAVKAYCKCIDEIATSGEDPSQHILRLEAHEAEMRKYL